MHFVVGFIQNNILSNEITQQLQSDDRARQDCIVDLIAIGNVQEGKLRASGTQTLDGIAYFRTTGEIQMGELMAPISQNPQVCAGNADAAGETQMRQIRAPISHTRQACTGNVTAV